MPATDRSILYRATTEIFVTRAPSVPPRRRELWFAAALIAYGAFLMAYSAWAAASDRKATKLFRESTDCERRTQDSAAFVSSPCRIERAVVVERTWHSTKGDGAAYELVTRSAQGRRDDIQMLEKPSVLFWRRVAPGESISVQRFVAPGYRLTGSITALSDKHGWTLMPAHPDRETHNRRVFIVLGGVLFTGGALLARSWVRRSRRVSATV